MIVTTTSENISQRGKRMSKREYESKTVNVYGDKFAREKNPLPAYQRQLATRPVTFTCVMCKQTVTQERYPGPTPRYCDVCKDEHEVQRNEERIRKQREKRQTQAAQKSRATREVVNSSSMS
jgi:hypothetical protein